VSFVVIAFVVYSLCVTSTADIAETIARIRERMAGSAQRSGRDPREITLMAVSKTVSARHIREAYAAGLRLFGENRLQELAGKRSELGDAPEAEWHMIGHLQTNKAARAAELFDAVDSLDSVRLAEKLNAAARALRKKLAVLIEINLAGETAKSGLAPGSRELEALLAGASGWQNLAIRGLMAIPPFAEDPEAARPYFRRLRQLRDQIAARRLPGVALNVLSMGMSHDFEVAIEEGSTCVRIGTAIFGERSRN